MSLTSLHAGFSIVEHIVAACALGWVVGYERYFNARAAGTQVYCLVSMASCAVTALVGYPDLWYDGTSHVGDADPTRVAGSILTGIGFLGAGVIMQSSTSVRGLTTAASIWASSAIGIMVGVGFWIAAAGLTALFVLSMTLVPRLERHLPARLALAVTIRYRDGHRPNEDLIHQFLEAKGLSILTESLSLDYDGGCYSLKFLMISRSMNYTHTLAEVSSELPHIPHVFSFSIARSSRA
ncbi:MAG: MgtC/SapB transporter [Nevskia sp.]|nr:MgtC/SapB transporter [Nevskia sp.]